MNKRIVAVIVSLLVLLMCGCQSKTDMGGRTLTVTVSYWTGTEGGSSSTTKEYDSLNIGDELCDCSFSELSVKKVTPEKIVLNSSGLIIDDVEPGINLNAECPKTITIKAGETVYLASPTMDGGVNITLEY